MYPASDPRSFYVCLPDGNPRLVECDAGHVFVNDDQVYGCAPFSLWPCNKNVVPIDCSGADRDTLVRAQDPHNYWICAAPNGTPTELPCPDGKGFVKNSTHMGCISWDGWSCNAWLFWMRFLFWWKSDAVALQPVTVKTKILIRIVHSSTFNCDFQYLWEVISLALTRNLRI